MDKHFGTAYPWLIDTLAMSGNQSEAFEWWMKWLALRNEDEETVQAFKTAYQTSGWQGILRERARRWEQGGEVYFNGAAYNSQIADKNKAFEPLEKSYQRRELLMGHLQVEPRLDSLRDDPRFDESVKRVELK